MKNKYWLLFLLMLVIIPSILAGANINTTITASEKAQFDKILEPVFKIYNFIKYISTVVAAIFLLYAGIAYMTSGSDPKKREQAKNITSYVIIGIVIIWAAPLLVELLI